jgi:GNAT superfamily N-acetyltransferase
VAFRPQINITYKLEADEKEMMKQYERTWALKDTPGIAVTKVHKAKADSDGAAKLSVQVKLDQSTDRASEAFDYDFDGCSTFNVPNLPTIPADFNIGLVVGPSGSGKTTLLKKHFNARAPHTWDKGMSVGSHFADQEVLQAVGLSKSVCEREFCTLSSGEKFRAECARSLQDGGVVDEFTSNVDRHLAKVVARSVGQYVRAKNIKGLVFATCHEDFIPWLRVDWVYSTQTQELLILKPCSPPALPEQPDMAKVDFQIPDIQINIGRNKTSNMWTVFAEFHYLNKKINDAAQFFVAYWNEVPVGCVAVCGFPGAVRQGTAKREHRTVILPDFQGLGIGTKFSDAVARIIFVHEGRFYFSRTAHPRFGAHRESSSMWVGTSANMSFLELKGVFGASSRITGEFKDSREKQKLRVCYSHMFVGTQEDRELFKKAVPPQVYDAFNTQYMKQLKSDQKRQKDNISIDELRSAAFNINVYVCMCVRV